MERNYWERACGLRPPCRRYYVPSELTAEQLEQNLLHEAKAHGQGKEAFNAELDQMFPEKSPDTR